MTTPIFPVLAGQGWSVKKAPKFSTLVAPHVSGREVRDAQYLNPIWSFELVFEGLDGTATGQYGVLGAQSLQSLMGLFLQCQGQYGTFLYYDPTDYQVSAQAFGVGNGSTTSFQLGRAMGTFFESIVAPFNPSTFAALSLPGAPYPAMNIFPNSVASGAGLALANFTSTPGQTDPFSGTNGVLLTETTANSAHFAADASSIGIVAGAPATFSVYLKAGTSRYVQLILDNPTGMNGAFANFDLSAGVVTYSAPTESGSTPIAAITAASGGFYRCSLSTIIGGGSTTAHCAIGGTNANPTAGVYAEYAGSASNDFTIACPQLEIDLALTAGPDIFVPTLATPNYGNPQIFEAGTLIDPSAYTLSNGLVTFNAAPSSGATLTWTGYFGFLCRFDSDDQDFEQFMSNLWRVDSLKFRSVRAQ